MSRQDADQLEEEFEKTTGMSLEKVITLYTRAVENDWRTVQAMTQKAISKFADSRAETPEQLLALSRAILKAENGGHLMTAGLAED